MGEKVEKRWKWRNVFFAIKLARGDKTMQDDIRTPEVQLLVSGYEHVLGTGWIQGIDL